MTEVQVLLREWEVQTPGRQVDHALRGRSLADADRELARVLRERKMLDVRELREGLEARAFSFVGRIRLGDVTVTVTPKVEAATLLALFPYAYGVRNVARHGSARFEMEGRLLQDLVVEMLHDEVEELLRRGLPRRYRLHREDLASPRGRVDMTRLAARGVATGTLPCEHFLRSEDWLLHQVLLGGLLCAADLSSSSPLRLRLHRLAAQLGERVSVLELHGRAVAEAIRGLDRLTRPCEPALRLIEALLEGRQISLDDPARGSSLPGFLFDMNRFFQALLSRFLGENLSGHEVVDEHRLRGLLRYAPDANPRQRVAPTPRPDFAIRSRGRVVALLDAKYRDLWERTLPREMLYQLSIYALSQPAGVATAILYPSSDVAAREARIEIRGPLDDWGRASVTLRPVSLVALKDAVVAEDNGAERRRQRLARWLAFGETAA